MSLNWIQKPNNPRNLIIEAIKRKKKFLMQSRNYATSESAIISNGFALFTKNVTEQIYFHQKVIHQKRWYL